MYLNCDSNWLKYWDQVNIMIKWPKAYGITRFNDNEPDLGASLENDVMCSTFSNSQKYK